MKRQLTPSEIRIAMIEKRDGIIKEIIKYAALVECADSSRYKITCVGTRGPAYIEFEGKSLTVTPGVEMVIIINAIGVPDTKANRCIVADSRFHMYNNISTALDS